MVSTDLKQEAWAPASNQPYELLVIDHADLASPIRVVNNTEDVTSNGDVYSAFPFTLAIPKKILDGPPSARLQISNVSREIVQAVRTITSAASVSIYVVRREAPDTYEHQYEGMTLHDVQWDALTVSGTVRFENLAGEPFPARTFSPAEFRGLIG